MEEKKKSNIGIIILVIVLLCAAFAGGMYAGVKEAKCQCKPIKKDSEETSFSDKLSDAEALKIGNELWKYAYSTYWGEEPAWVSKYENNEKICVTTADEIKEKYSSDFKVTGAIFNNEEKTIDESIPKDCLGGRGGNQFYKDTKLEVKSVEEDEIVFTAISSYCDRMLCQDSNPKVQEEKEEKKDFIIEKEDDEWLIKYFYLPN